MIVTTNTTGSTKLCHATPGQLVRICDTMDYLLVGYKGFLTDGGVKKLLSGKTEGLYAITDDVIFVSVLTGREHTPNLSSRCHIIEDAEIIVKTVP